VPTTTLILATGNHLVISGDLRTRALLCRIDPKVERPEERRFEHDLREWAMAHRPQLVVAGLTVMRAFVAQQEEGMKDRVPTWGRFERWSEMVRAPLVWLGCQDPCASIKALEDEDPDRGEHLRLMHEWRAAFGDQAMSAREAVQQAQTDTLAQNKPSPLQEIFRDIATDRGGTISSRRLGKWLQRYAGRRAKGQQFIKEGELNHVALWKVEVFDKG
jgi:putative DNA primase/helicase